MDDNATHQRVLCSAIAQTTGPVLEIGVGNYSTPLLHELCRGRLLVSLEYNPYDGRAWFEQFRQYESPSHQLEYLDEWRGFKDFITGPWDVVLIDSQPQGVRVQQIAVLAPQSKWLVIHDTESAVYGYEPMLSQFAYRFDWKHYPAWTSVVSNVAPFQLRERE